MTRTLETLIEQFDKASELDTLGRVTTGETYWLEVDGIRTRMVDAWMNELSQEEKATFETYIAGVIDGAAKALGFENSEAQFKDAGQKVFSGLVMGLQYGQSQL